MHFKFYHFCNFAGNKLLSGGRAVIAFRLLHTVRVWCKSENSV